MIAKASQILGTNARSIDYLKPLNKKKGRLIANSKLLTKKYLTKAGLPTPQLLAVFRTPREVEEFNWLSLPDNFVLKPASGLGGEGVIIIKKRAKYAGEWHLMDDSIINTADLKQRVLDILAGRHSLHNLPDRAMIEERIKIAKVFRKYAFQGTPDIRVIVFNKVPVMAMLRLPTAQSKGKANLHQGAVGVGVDIATGITTDGIHKGNFIRYIPGTKRKVNGLKLPHWHKILTLAVKAQEAVPSLGFMGVDIVFDKKHGPVILELNNQPGLEIQNANRSPLKKRLERIVGLKVRDAENGVNIGKTLFAERFTDRVMAEEGVKTVKVWETVKIRSADKKKVEVKAKIDTGAWRTSIDRQLAEELGLLRSDNVLWSKIYKSGLGVERREVIGLTFYLAGRKIETIASVSDRGHLRAPVIIGRKDLGGFMVKPRQ
ncbi:MAG: ATP-grasp domain-containing protein [Candidatus Marinimicrobia bacterium]|nr:ATP-grasp domain-containing protein [Candidatus Neomarinimicrobiota bacterium]